MDEITVTMPSTDMFQVGQTLNVGWSSSGNSTVKICAILNRTEMTVRNLNAFQRAIERVKYFFSGLRYSVRHLFWRAYHTLTDYLRHNSADKV